MPPILVPLAPLFYRPSTAKVLEEGSELDRSKFIGCLSLFDDSPPFKRGQQCLRDEVGQRGSGEQLHKVSLVGPVGEIVGVIECFDYLFGVGSIDSHLII